LAAALPLILYYRAATRRDPALLWRDPELRALFAAVALVSLLLFAVGDLPVQDAVFHAVNAQTTTGFSSTDLSAVDNSSKLVLIFSMLTGAGLGSTGGGVKLLRLLILLRLVQLIVLRAQLPRHGVALVRIGGSSVDETQISRAGAVVLLYGMIIIFSWAAFVTAGHPPLDALFEVVSATATVGLSVGISGPELASWLKAVLCFDMLAGRLEVLALVVVMSPRTWFKRGS
jgi:trk system potassium uptake protein TrkH